MGTIFKVIMLYIVISAAILFLTGCTDLGTQFSISQDSSTSTEAETIDVPSEDVMGMTRADNDYIDISETLTETAENEPDEKENNTPGIEKLLNLGIDSLDIPAFDGTCAWVEINDDQPYFDINITDCFEYYSEKDELGRCGTAVACLGKELMPTEERGEIGHIKPSGWHTVKYTNLIEGNYLYNRCHLIGYQLTGENDNNKNLITGTRFLNLDGMLLYENEMASYIYKHPDYHILYRVTPIYKGEDLVASGVIMEGKSMETDDICFCVYCYNEQPGITIDHHTGDSEQTGEYYDIAIKYNYSSVIGKLDTETYNETEDKDKNITYIINTNTGKFHSPQCESVTDIKEKNRIDTNKSKEELILEGYGPCKRCNP